MQTNLPASLDPFDRPSRPARRAAGSTVFRAANDASWQRSMRWPTIRRPRAVARASTSGSSGTGQLWTLGARSIWSHLQGRDVPVGRVPTVAAAGRWRPRPATAPTSTERTPRCSARCPPEADFTALEAEELARWAEHRVFERSVELRAGAEPWVFYEGPPTANGRPGLHHVWARVYKDLFCRYRTMRGYAVPRKAGWDTHGLPVEVEVEKQLGITAKHQIEETGRHRRVHPTLPGVGPQLRRRVEGPDRAHRLLDRLRRRLLDLLARVRRGGVVEPEEPLGPGPPLRGHQGGAVLPALRDRAVQPRARPARRLPRGRGRVGLRALPAARRRRGSRAPARPARPRHARRALARGLDDHAVDAALQHRRRGRPRPRVRGGRRRDRGRGGPRVAGARRRRGRPTARVRGSDLVGLHYDRPFADLEPAPGDGRRDGWRVVAGEFVEADEGTGIVHLAPAFGEVDRQAGRENDLPTLNPVGPDGRFTDAVRVARGPDRCARPTPQVNDRLEAVGRLLRRELLRPPLPPLLAVRDRRSSTGGSRAGTSGTSERKADLVAAEPDHRVAPGAHPRRADGGVVGQQRRLGALARPVLGHPPSGLAVRRGSHRAAWGRSPSCPSSRVTTSPTSIRTARTSTEVTFDCPECAGGVPKRPCAGSSRSSTPGSTRDRCRRAQWGYPLVEGSAEQFVFPADFICEAIDQTRGWFYSLLAVNTLVRGATPYRNVLCLGHIVDADGRKMSKSIGNVIDPWEILVHPGGRPAALVDVLAGFTVDADPGQLRRHRRRDARRPCSRCGTPGRSSRPTPRSTSSTPPTRPIPPPARALGPRPVDAVAPARHGGHGHRRRSTATSRSRRPPPSPSWSTTSPTGTCAGAADASGGPTRTPTRPTRSAPRPPCTRCW